MSKKCRPGCACGRHARNGRTLDPERRLNIIKANQARKGQSRGKCPPGCTCNRHKAYYRGGSQKGRTFSPEARERIAEGARNRDYTDEARQRLVDEMLARHADPDWEAKRVAGVREALAGTECPEGCECGKHAAPPSLPQHKRSDGQKGYIYAIEFSTGVVKVGRTTSPRQRINSQLYVASKLGVEPRNIWLSAFHENYKANEVELLGRLGAPTRGEEYFQVAFDHVVKMAEDIIQRYEPSL